MAEVGMVGPDCSTRIIRFHWSTIFSIYPSTGHYWPINPVHVSFIHIYSYPYQWLMHLSLFLNTGCPLVVGEKHGAPLMAPDHILCCVGGAVQAVDASVVAGGSANNFKVTEICKRWWKNLGRSVVGDLS